MRRFFIEKRWYGWIVLDSKAHDGWWTRSRHLTWRGAKEAAYLYNMMSEVYGDF